MRHHPTLVGYVSLSLNDDMVAATEGDERYPGGGIFNGYRTLSSTFPELCKTMFGSCFDYVCNYNSRNKFNRENWMRVEEQKLNINLVQEWPYYPWS